MLARSRVALPSLPIARRRTSKNETRSAWTQRKSCFEADHIGGRNQIPHLTVDECQLHHAILTEERLVAGAEMEKQQQPIKSVEMALRSLAVTGRAIAWAIEKISEGVEFCADALKRVRR